jgi:hypothetical protein
MILTYISRLRLVYALALANSLEKTVPQKSPPGDVWGTNIIKY